MLFFGISSVSELLAFATSLSVGISMIMGVNAVNSAPGFMLSYYKYILRAEDAVPKNKSAWKNILTIYTVVTQVTQMLMEPTNLTPFLQRFSLVFRLETSSLLMLTELLVIVIMPHTCKSESGALAGLIMAAFIGGFGRAFFENTCYALFGAFPFKYMAGVMSGVPISAAVVSVLQIILLASMKTTYSSLLTQSAIYFGVSIGFIILSIVLVFSLLFNSFARRYVAEFRTNRSPWKNIYCPAKKNEMIDPAQRISAEVPPESAAPMESAEPVDGRVAELELGDANTSPVEQPSSVEQKLAPSFGMKELDGDGEVQMCELQDAASPTTAEVLQQVHVWQVVKKVYPMMIACFLSFLFTYLLYPGVLIAVNNTDEWYMTLIMAAYNFSDLVGRVITMWKKLWPSRMVVLISSIARVIFVPLLILCAFHKIPSEAAAYVFTILMGLTTGYIGTMSMIYSPETPSLQTHGERIVAGQLTGVCLLGGCAIGSLLQLAIVLGF